MKHTDALRLKAKEERRILRGHLWVYRNELETALPVPDDGAAVDVVSSQGRFVGRGFHQAQGGIAVRILTHKDEAVDAGLVRRRIQSAGAFRDSMFPGESAYRWVFGESDRLPGLVADRYGPVVSARTACGFYRAMAEEVGAAFMEHDGVKGVHLEVCGLRQTFGNVSSPVETIINGLRFRVDVVEGQKTGMFLDQRANALAARAFCKGARVLDGHCHEGQWSLNLAQAGAASTIGVDTSASAIERARANAELNGLDTRCAFECADIAEVLQRRERYDVVILDPPGLAKSRSQTQHALRLHQAMNEQAMKAVEPGGILITSSCSHFVEREAFVETLKRAARGVHRAAWIVDVRGASMDHPVLMAMPETAYLTCVFLRVF